MIDETEIQERKQFHEKLDQERKQFHEKLDQERKQLHEKLDQERKQLHEKLDQKRIRDKAPYRKSMSLTEEDLMRASELERIFNNRFKSEAPFNFSKTISKALELAIVQMLQPAGQSQGGRIQQDLTGLPADPEVLQAREQQKKELEITGQQKTKRVGKFQKRK